MATIDVNNPRAGLYHGVSYEEYAALPFIRKSYLQKMKKCPAAARVKEPDTPALKFGRAFHSYILDGDSAFGKAFIVMPTVDRRTAAGKKTFAEFQEAAGSREIITSEDFLAIQSMRDAIMSHPSAKLLLEGGRAESTAIWQDEATGLWCKCRPDYSTYGEQNTLVDAKKTRSADPHLFQRDIVKFGYDLQAGMYLTGASIASGIKFDAFVLIACEDTPPYRVEVYAMSDEFVKHGKFEFARLMREEKFCRDNGVWPHYKYPGIDTVEIPGYLSLEKGVFEALPDGSGIDLDEEFK